MKELIKDSVLRYAHGFLLGSLTVLVIVIGQYCFALLDLTPTAGFTVGLFFTYLLKTLAVAFFEEYLFRVVLLKYIGIIFNNVYFSVLSASIIFSIAHIGNEYYTIAAFISHFLGGIMYCCAYVKTKNIWLPFGLHSGWNLAQVILGMTMNGSDYRGLFKIDFYLREIYQGGDYGFEGGIVAIVARLFILGYLLFVYKVKAVSSKPI
ncbi:CPBP family intramembrane metalloprotease [Hymenobacter sp. BT18]|uniref:CPBP family intramembrane glutamic endopeptidase n=1 Tax=Hymenobacter sp. BT18 TaxID=2835648 RepID=UPI00143E4561|nr:CPBP family intramembrane glutamic endopeptidase [Hymenobacter sp. BT18]QIX62676.1 CPBP family intramembrane metalloprotease [Hymenobacter sp. BT18]